jgi:uncharacterized protein
MVLTFKVEDIPPEGKTVSFAIPAVEARRKIFAGEKRLCLGTPLTGELDLERAGREILVRGRVRTTIKTECARCLEEFDLPSSEEILVVFMPHQPGSGKEDVEPEDLHQEYFDGETIDVGPIIEEQLVLSLPIKPLCLEECRGLCPVCGQNLNQDTCQCQPQTGHPGLAALQGIRAKLPD